MVPQLGPRVPQRGNRFSRWLGRCVLRACGWSIVGNMPDQSRFVIIGAPHTSNLDGVFGLAAMLALGLRATIMIKDSAFWWPLGSLLRWFGAIAVDRSSPKGLVEQTIDAFERRPQMVLLVAPEGTRKAARSFRSGFHRIAVGAAVDIVPAAVNFKRRVFVVGPALTPGDDYQADLQQLLAFFGQNGHPCRSRNLSWPLRDGCH